MALFLIEFDHLQSAVTDHLDIISGTVHVWF